MDDDPVTLMTTAECVRAERHEVETAVDGLEAFAKYKSGQFNLVITDQGMPKMNGTQLATAIKGSGAKTPVIMLTGNWQMVSGGEEGSDAVDMVVGKPITRSGIRDAIAKVLKAGV